MADLKGGGKRQYSGRVIDVDIETVSFPDGHQFDLEVIRHPGGAAVVAIDELQRVCMLKQYRHVVGGWLWELPAGKIDAAEPHHETAKRELEEEAGLRASQWQSLGQIYTSPGVFTEIIHLYLAQGLETVSTAHEAEELIEIQWLDFKAALKMAHNGDIVDAKTLIGLFRATDVLDPDQ